MKHNFYLQPLAFAVLVALGSPAAQADDGQLEKVTITGAGDKLGVGLLQQQDGARARSDVNKAALEKQSPTSNIYQGINMLPGVNASSQDNSGMFGGALTIRGFNSDQIGVTINGVPVNDSGSYAVYPQEFVDLENLCQGSVTQGSSDTDAPHMGASGGNMSFVTCDPEKERRVRIAQSLGSNSLQRTYIRGDTGLFADGKARAFMSYSHSEVDKWKGAGGMKRDHIDTGVRYDFSGGYINASVLYNRQLGNAFGTPTLQQLQQTGYNFDNSTSFAPGHLPPQFGTTQKETGPTPAYYQLQQNPFENVIAKVDAVLKLSADTRIKIQPYFWYGYGGGTSQQTQAENGFLNPATHTNTASKDLNGDGDTLDTIVVNGSSITRTRRPGITITMEQSLGNHLLQAGVWYERAQHIQTGQESLTNADGSPSDPWMRSNLLTRPDGSLYQYRDWETISTATQLFAIGTFNFLDDRLSFNAGLRTPQIKRDFTNHANEGCSGKTACPAAYDYTINKTYRETLPSFGARYFLTPKQQMFFNITKNYRAVPNYAYSGSNGNVQVINGQVVLVNDVQPETSVNTDLGYRWQGDLLTFSGSLFNVDFRNRQASSYDPITQKSVNINAGDVHTWGGELELGTVPVKGWSAYASLTSNHSEIKNNLDWKNNGTVTPLLLQGNDFPLTPRWMAALSLQYAPGAWYVRTDVKHTGKQFATLANDEVVPEYTTVDLDAGYRFGNMGVLKNPTLKLNVSNMFNTSYRIPTSSKVNAADTVRYNLGAPRSASVTMQVDF
ncbi:TonB-dependent receptor [Chromobacterium sp. IIBBL 290-4]|uniref:TonB-dependent receptor n=1 Tax=Chromobacterium sp. IIBBL 290-4 TaxID=2953890 RepID=UPI0020B7B401|nr:TonB-dependent receptor [Chromobacterium sp. IIBBL 290-4]UTH74400.1 TonB-dependent receptor [Chromobacterium sp. IIBBL 290-4]